MAIEPRKRFVSGCHRWALRDEWTLNHNDWQSERSRCFNLRNRCAPPRILGQNDVDGVLAEELDVLVGRERPGGLHHDHVRQSRGRGWPIDEPNDIGMVGCGFEGCNREASDAAKNSSRFGSNRLNGRIHALNAVPAISVNGLPCRPFDRNEWRSRSGSCLQSVAAHLAGKRMCGIDQDIHLVLEEEAAKAAYAAESADANGEWLRAGLSRASGKGHGCLETRIGSERLCEAARFSGAAEKENAHGAFC